MSSVVAPAIKTFKNCEQQKLDIQSLILGAQGGSVLIIGAGVTGRALARVFSEAGFSVCVIDENPLKDEVKSYFTSLLGAKVFDSFTCKAEELEKINNLHASFACLSPGIPPQGKLITTFKALNIPIISELDVGVTVLGMPDVAVTGTNGKTTTVTLIAEMLRASGEEVELVGNVGKPFLECLSGSQLIESLEQGETDTKKREQKFVSEMSSYQLETVQFFCPYVAVCLNIDDDHLERHETIEKYIAAKGRIFGSLLESNYSVIPIGIPYSDEIAAYARGRVFRFGPLMVNIASDENGSYYFPAKGIVQYRNGEKKEIYSLANWKLLGRHNILNLCAAITASRLSGATPEGVQKVIDTFQSLPHRLEIVQSPSEEIIFINDSKGTNPSGTAAAIDAVREKYADAGIILLVGGSLKQGSWQCVRERLGHVKAVIGFGGDGEKVLSELALRPSNDFTSSEFALAVALASTVAEAVRFSRRIAGPGNIVLFSPGCSSFDQYQNYERRGEEFKRFARGEGESRRLI